MLSVLGHLPQQVGDDLRERLEGQTAARRPPDPVRGRVPEDRPIARSICFPPALDKQAPLGLYGYQPDPATGEYPLALISPASERTISSTLGELTRPEVRLEMNPDDADARGIEEGDADSRVERARRNAHQRAAVTPLVKRGIVTMPKGVWRRNTTNGYTSNALVPDTLSDLGGGACFNDARVQVEKVRSETRAK